MFRILVFFKIYTNIFHLPKAFGQNLHYSKSETCLSKNISVIFVFFKMLFCHKVSLFSKSIICLIDYLFSKQIFLFCILQMCPLFGKFLHFSKKTPSPKVYFLQFALFSKISHSQTLLEIHVSYDAATTTFPPLL